MEERPKIERQHTLLIFNNAINVVSKLTVISSTSEELIETLGIILELLTVNYPCVAGLIREESDTHLKNI